MSILERPSAITPSDAGSTDMAALPRWARAEFALPLFLVVAAILQQSLTALDPDVSWLLTVGERFFDGQRIYVDILEVNPPASFLIYLPGIAFGRMVGLTAEFGAATSIFVLGAFCIAAAGRILAAAGLMTGANPSFLAAGAIFSFLFLPAQCFAQREHVAVLTLLPLLAVLFVRAEGRHVGGLVALLAGIGGGITVAIKPHFALAILLPLLLVAWRRRSLYAACGPEIVGITAVAVGYAIMVAVFFPSYFNEVVPLVAATYLPVRKSFFQLAADITVLLFAVLGVLCIWLAGRRIVVAPAAISLLAAAGFSVAYFIQGKGFLNHGYPSVALTVFAIVQLLAERQIRPRREWLFGCATLAVISTCATCAFAHIGNYTDFAQKVALIVPRHPRVIVAAANLDIGHPLTRWLGGQWVGRRCSLWVTANVTTLLDSPSLDHTTRDKLKAYAQEDARIFAEDAVSGRPDLVIVDATYGEQWIVSHPAVAEALSAFHSVATVDGMEIWLRAPSPGRS